MSPKDELKLLIIDPKKDVDDAAILKLVLNHKVESEEELTEIIGALEKNRPAVAVKMTAMIPKTGQVCNPRR